MNKSIEEEVREVLNEDPDKVIFEEPKTPINSPLNIPVAEPEEGPPMDSTNEENSSYSQENDDSDLEPVLPEEMDDVPEQEIGEGNFEDHPDDFTGEEFELPEGHAKQAAETILGMADNVLAVGGGFLIKIKKHQGFYDFEEIIQVIDEQNEKNVKRIKLDKEDKILLRPLLISLLKQKAKKLTPEQQLLGAILSILMKKTQIVLEIRAENEMLTQKILDIIQEEKGVAENHNSSTPEKEHSVKSKDVQNPPAGTESVAQKETEKTNTVNSNAATFGNQVIELAE